MTSAHIGIADVKLWCVFLVASHMAALNMNYSQQTLIAAASRNWLKKAKYLSLFFYVNAK